MRLWRWLKSLFKKKKPVKPSGNYKPNGGIANRYRGMYADLKEQVIGSQRLGAIDWTIRVVKKNEKRYQRAEIMLTSKGIRVPWEVIAALHMREASGDFRKNMMNGQPLDRVTTWVPKGYGPWDSWEDSCVDAFKIKKMPESWDIGTTLDWCERFNGLGYRGRGINSPYIWAYSQYYNKGGYYVSDGKFSKTAIAQGLGVAVILKRLGY